MPINQKLKLLRLSSSLSNTLFYLGQVQCDGVQILVTIKLGAQIGQLGEVCNEVHLILCTKSKLLQLPADTLPSGFHNLAHRERGTTAGWCLMHIPQIPFTAVALSLKHNNEQTGNACAPPPH